MNTPIHDFLTEYENSRPVRCHMPGGKGLIYPRDITEIMGADVLYESGGIIRESERNAASLFGAAETCYSCGGSTLSIQAMLCAVRQASQKPLILAGRYSHKSLINSAILLGFEVEWLYPDSFLGTDIPAERIRAALTPDTAAVFLNGIDYYGGQADVASAAKVCAEYGVPLLIDNAHGAYRVFTGDHPITLGAAMTADSAHKTLPALTGSAYLHIADARCCHNAPNAQFYPAAKAAMPLFGSSSPSYLMLESLDLCNRFIAEEKARALAALEAVAALKKRLADAEVPLRESDAMRVTISSREMGYTGCALAEKLRESRIECELCDDGYVVLLFSVVQPHEDFQAVADALCGIEKKAPLPVKPIPVVRAVPALPPREAFLSRTRLLPVKNAIGSVSAESPCPCPPCVPLVTVGELITADAAELLTLFGVSAVKVVDA